MARGEEGLQVLRNHCVEHRIAGITRRVGGNRWRHNSPHRQQGEDESARSCPPIYCSNVQYTSKKLTRECGGNMRDASPCRAAVAKSAFGIPVHTSANSLIISIAPWNSIKHKGSSTSFGTRQPVPVSQHSHACSS